MKKLLAIALLLIGTSVQGAIYDAYVTVTNGTTNGHTITVNGSVRTFTNSVTIPATQISTNATIGGTTTNLFQHWNGYGTFGIGASITNTNVVKFTYTSPLTITVSAGWATVAYDTISGEAMKTLRVPLSGETGSVRTNNASLAVTGLSDYSTNAFSTNAIALSNYVTRSTAQTIGNKTITNSTWNNGTISGATISGTLQNVTNGYSTGLVASALSGTNWSVVGGFRSVGDGVDSTIIGNAVASGDYGIAIGYDIDAAYNYSVVIGYQAGTVGEASVSIGSAAIATNSAIAIGNDSFASGTGGVALGEGAGVDHINSVAIGSGATTTTSNQVVLGSSTVNSIVAAGVFHATGGTTNIVLRGTNDNKGDLSFTRYDVTTLANGANAGINPRTNVYLKVSGPTAAFTINGIVGGRDGRVLIIQNSTGYAMTIANDSGVDPASTNRIYTSTGSDVTITNNPGSVTLLYDASVSRWVLQNIPGGSVAGVTSVGLNGTANKITISGTSPITGSGTLTATIPDEVELVHPTTIGRFIVTNNQLDFITSSATRLSDAGGTPITNKLTGFSQYHLTSAFAPLVKITNALSVVHFDADKIVDQTTGGDQTNSIIYQTGGKFRGRIRHIETTNSAVQWDDGEMYLSGESIKTSTSINAYGVWAEVNTNTPTGDLYLNYDSIDSANPLWIYDGHNDRRIWADVKTITGTSSSAAVYVYEGNKFYLNFQKILNTNGPGAQFDAFGAWVKGDKISSAGFALKTSAGESAPSTLYADISEIEDLGHNEYLVVLGGTEAYFNFKSIVSGSNSRGLNHGAGTNFVMNGVIDTRASTNENGAYPVFVEADNLTLKNVTLLAPPGVESVSSFDPFTVTIEGTLTVNTAPSANITFVGGTLIVNGDATYADDVTVNGALQLGNTAVAETPTATHTITIKDATGTTYRVLAVP